MGRQLRIGCVAVCAAIWAGAPVAGAAVVVTPPVACSWYVQSNPDAVNVAYPDEGAAYWGTKMAQIPSTGLTLRGRFPRARYFSIHAYDPLLRPTGAIGDADIDPATGVNPFRAPGTAGGPSSAAGGERDGTYVVRIVPQAPPAKPAPNTIYAGATHEGHANPGGIVLYRVYVPDDASDPDGGVGLPAVGAGFGGAVEVPFGQCDVTGTVPSLGVNEAIRDSDYPDWAPRTRPTRDETDPPGWNKFFGYGTLTRQVPSNPLSAQLTPGGGGFLSNVHNDYIAAAINRTHGDVVVIRARMPTFPATRRGEPPWAERQLRYWSICQNETVSQRYVACVTDEEAVLEPGGWATFVVSDPGDRPQTATPEHRVNWLPWGGWYPEGRIIYRQMVARPSFREAVARIGPGDSVRNAMGDFYPVIGYCAKERFDEVGAAGCLEGR